MSKKTQITPAVVSRFKQNAKKLKKSKNITQAKALDVIAQQAGYSNWKEIVSAQTTLEVETQSHFEQNSLLVDVECDDDSLLTRNRLFLAKKGIEYSIFEPTPTGLKKSIIDATHQVRAHFDLFEFHDYGAQQQGREHKIIKHVGLVSSVENTIEKMSLYRPDTKKGDPRMWFTGLRAFSQSGDKICIVILQAELYLINLSNEDLEKSYQEQDELGALLAKFDLDNTISTELLTKLKELAKNELPAIGAGDTTIGMTIEAALGIPANSSKKPDYKGIELKSSRNRTKNRKTLFAQVADWNLSQCKSSAEILDKYGYERDGDFKLYCSVSSKKANSQGLKFQYIANSDELKELHDIDGDVATWTGKVLRNRLQEKHAETFWVSASVIEKEGKEYFFLESVVHTKSPLLSQLMPLLDSGVITMDHLIKRKQSNNRVSEKGPLFKISDRDLNLLFPEPIEYNLN